MNTRNGNLSSTPTFEEIVYQNLPSMLKEITNQFTEKRERDLSLVSSLVVLGGCFTNVKGKYDRDWIHPNLFSFIVAPPANGKSVMKYAKLLGKTIQQNFTNQNDLANNNYEVKLRERRKLAKESKVDAIGAAPEKPKNPVLFIPGNSSSASMYNLLADSDGKGIICETEADTLTGAIKQDWGNFSHLLRSAFQHEPVGLSRAANKTYISIERPCLSTLLSGTPDQVSPLIGTNENGLFSRFLFYCYKRNTEWIDPIPCDTCPDISDFFNGLSSQIAEIKKQLDSNSYIFNLTKNQFLALSTNFREKLELTKLSVEGDSESSVFRLGLICFRIAMTLTVLRNMDNLSNVKQLECSDIDFQTALSLTDTLYEHSIVMYLFLPAQKKTSFKVRIDDFYKLLPSEERFSRKSANELGKSIGLSEKTVGNYLNKLKGEEYLNDADFGYFIKNS